MDDFLSKIWDHVEPMVQREVCSSLVDGKILYRWSEEQRPTISIDSFVILKDDKVNFLLSSITTRKLQQSRHKVFALNVFKYSKTLGTKESRMEKGRLQARKIDLELRPSYPCKKR